jgi:hypothetical protein
MKLTLINRGFLYGSAAAILFILAKVARYGGGAAHREIPIYIAVILVCGLVGAGLCCLAQALFAPRPDTDQHRRKHQSRRRQDESGAG